LFSGYIPPALAYALTFLSMWWVDVTPYVTPRCGSQLDRFYFGVGGAGIWTLFLVPLFTALAAGYATARMRSRVISQHEPSSNSIDPVVRADAQLFDRCHRGVTFRSLERKD
jgi:hypothetical protein